MEFIGREEQVTDDYSSNFFFPISGGFTFLEKN